VASPADQIIVHVEYSANSRKNDFDLANFWQTQTLEHLKNSVYLIGSKGVKVPIKQFTVEGGAKREFCFIFLRQQNGKDIVSSGDKSLKLEFTYPVFSRLGDGNGFIEFETDKMVVQGRLVY
jgi:hypothetical protein